MFENAEIIPVNSPELTEAAKMLFRDYEKWLNVSLCFQGFEEEVNTLPGKYAPPEGRLYIVRQKRKIYRNHSFTENR